MSFPQHLPSYKLIFLSILLMITAQTILLAIMKSPQPAASLFGRLAALVKAQSGYVSVASGRCNATDTTIDLSWHAPAQTEINNLTTVINGTGIYGFVFNSSQHPPRTYDWCNMPHVNLQTYPKVNDSSYKLQYVEVIQRHQKRTPYAANTFPVESYPW